MRKVLILIVLLVFANEAYCDYTITTTEYTPVYSQNRNFYNRNFHNRNLNRLERQMLNRNFRKETPQQRLERLEQNTFGSIQQGDMNSRYAALKRASNQSNFYQPRQSWWNNVFQNFTAGVPTGFSPPVTDNYYGYQNNYYDSFGNYQNHSYQFQPTTRVRILD